MNLTQDLWATYVRTGSDSAFRELVRAYIGFVYSVALRIVAGDRLLAEDISQTVFTDLARKASLFPEKLQLGGWLHRHTCFVARKALRSERRLKKREQQSVELQLIGDYTPQNLS